MAEVTIKAEQAVGELRPGMVVTVERTPRIDRLIEHGRVTVVEAEAEAEVDERAQERLERNPHAIDAARAGRANERDAVTVSVDDPGDEADDVRLGDVVDAIAGAVGDTPDDESPDAG